MLACAVALAVLLPGCKPQPKPPAPQAQAPAEPQIQPAQLYGRWLISSMDGESVDRAMVESHELEFSPGEVRSAFVDAQGAGVGGVFAWRVSGSTLTLTVEPSSGATSSTRISIDGDYLVIEPTSPFPAPKDFQSRTTAYKRAP